MTSTPSTEGLPAWVRAIHPEAWHSWIRETHQDYATLSTYIKVKHPAIWVEWRMSQ